MASLFTKLAQRARPSILTQVARKSVSQSTLLKTSDANCYDRVLLAGAGNSSNDAKLVLVQDDRPFSKEFKSVDEGNRPRALEVINIYRKPWRDAPRDVTELAPIQEKVSDSSLDELSPPAPFSAVEVGSTELLSLRRSPHKEGRLVATLIDNQSGQERSIEVDEVIETIGWLPRPETSKEGMDAVFGWHQKPSGAIPAVVKSVRDHFDSEFVKGLESQLKKGRHRPGLDEKRRLQLEKIGEAMGSSYGLTGLKNFLSHARVGFDKRYTSAELYNMDPRSLAKSSDDDAKQIRGLLHGLREVIGIVESDHVRIVDIENKLIVEVPMSLLKGKDLLEVVRSFYNEEGKSLPIKASCGEGTCGTCSSFTLEVLDHPNNEGNLNDSEYSALMCLYGSGEDGRLPANGKDFVLGALENQKDMKEVESYPSHHLA